MHFFFEILLWACFAFPKCVTLDLENRGRKRVGFYTSDPPTTERSHAGRLLHSSRGKEWGFHFKFCFLLFVGTRFINHRPNCTVHFSYTQSGICKNTNYIHHLIKGSFSFVPCYVVWKAKRNKPWKTKESWHVEHCMSGIRPHYEPGNCHHAGVTSDYNHLQHYFTSSPHTHHCCMIICQSNNSKNNSQIPLYLWHSSPSSMLSRSAMSHNPLDCRSLFKRRDDFQCFSLLAFSWWGSEEPALWWVNDRALHQVNPNGYNIRKRRKVLCPELILEIRKFLARKCFEQLMNVSRNHSPDLLPSTPQLYYVFMLWFKTFIILYPPNTHNGCVIR